MNPQKRERRKKATARCFTEVKVRGGSRTAATSKMEHFVIIVNGWKPLTIIINSSILDVAAVLDPPLTVIIYLINLYKGDYGINLIKPIKTSTKETIPEKHFRIISTSTKLRSQFNIKDDTNKQQKHDFVYFTRCMSTICTDRCVSKPVVNDAGRDTKSHTIRQCLNSDHEIVNIENFKILNMGLKVEYLRHYL